MERWSEKERKTERETDIDGQIVDNNKIRTELDEQKRVTDKKVKNQLESGLFIPLMLKSTAT